MGNGTKFCLEMVQLFTCGLHRYMLHVMHELKLVYRQLPGGIEEIYETLQPEQPESGPTFEPVNTRILAAGRLYSRRSLFACSLRSPQL